MIIDGDDHAASWLSWICKVYIEQARRLIECGRFAANGYGVHCQLTKIQINRRQVIFQDL